MTTKPPKKRKGGAFLALIGLCIGLGLGFTVVAIKDYAKDQITTLLTEEVAKACDCQFAADSIEISLLGLRGVAHNARIIEHGVDRLLVKRIEARFNLSKITERII